MSKKPSSKTISKAAAALGAKGGAKRAIHPNKSELARRAGQASGQARRSRPPAPPAAPEPEPKLPVTWGEFHS